MSRVDITIGLLAILATVAVTALVGFGEEARMERDSRGWDARKVEVGAELFEQYCASCHGTNAVGGICPPLDETSGLQGGEMGPGVAWRLEELGWDATMPFDYVRKVIASGRTHSTRPDRYPGNRVSAPAGRGPAAAATSLPQMAMPAHGQDYGGPLRPDQVEALAHYIVSFGDAVPSDPDEALAAAEEYREEFGSEQEPPPTAVPTRTPTAEADLEEATLTTGEAAAAATEAAAELTEPAATDAAPTGGEVTPTP